MNRLMTLAAALLIMVTGMAVAAPEADAGLFNRNKCCKPQRQGLFAKRKAKKCCEQTCCEPEPCCEVQTCGCEAPAPAPCGCEAASACGCEAEVQTCGCSAPVQTCGCETNCDCLNRRQLRRAQRKGECCGVKANTCSSGCAAPAADCGCSGEAAPAPEAAEEAAPEAPATT